MGKGKRCIFWVWGLATLIGVLPGIFSSPVQAMDNSDCLDCHSDDSLERSESEGIKSGLYIDSNRFKFSVHNVNEVGCVDCHSDIEKLDYDDNVPHPVSLQPVLCEGCHEAEGEAYRNSVHSKASNKGVTIPCYSCHEYHYVTHLEASSVFERENAFCLKCHNADKYHDWLPQKEAHFSLVECTVCHAPEVPRYIALRFFDLVKNKFFTTNDFLAVLNVDHQGFMPMFDRNNDGILDTDEIGNIVLVLRQKNAIGTFHGELVVDIVPEVHQVNRGMAARECEQCHNPESPFFREVNICLNRDDGTRLSFKVDRKVLESYYVNHFYAIGGTRVRLLDKIGIALVGGGVLVVIAHLSARILTIPVRRKRKERGEGKGRARK